VDDRRIVTTKHPNPNAIPWPGTQNRFCQKLVQTIHNAVGLPSAGGWLIRTLPFWDIHLLHERIIHRLTRNQLPVELGRVCEAGARS
jgi:hypothetical protein